MLTKSRFAIVLAIALTSLALPAAAESAAVAGENGIIFFTSGRGGAAGNDNEAKIYGRTILSGTGLGTVIGPFSTTPGVQYKHPAISPDRTKLAYSRGTPGTFLTEDFDIYVQDLDSGAVTPITTPGDGVTSDRAAWSPNGRYLAYDNEEGTNNTGGRDIFVLDLQTGLTNNLTATTGLTDAEGKAAWTPDSQTIYYQRGNPTTTNAMNIRKRPATGGSETVGVPDTSISEFQPSISPDGTQICYTLGEGINANTSILTAPLNNLAATTIIASDPVGPPAEGNINCSFSPDGTLIAYTHGVFTAGALVMERADGSDLVPITLTDEPAHFDGNADWAVDGLPVCFDATVTTTPGKAINLPLRCEDTGPLYERTPVTVLTGSTPVNGTLGDEVQGNPAVARYTPNPGFLGTEKITFRGFDAHNFAPGSKTVTVVVALDPPKLTKLKVASRIKRGKKAPKLSGKRKGTTISFTLSKAANVTFTFKRTGRLRQAITTGKFTLAGKAGINRVVFFGKVSAAKSLALGKYKVSVSAKDSDGAKSATQVKRFTLK